MTHKPPYVSEWSKLCTSCGLPNKPFYSTQETSQLVGCARSTVLRWVKVGTLDGRRWGPRRVSITATSIRNALQLPHPVPPAHPDPPPGRTDAAGLRTDAVDLHGPPCRPPAHFSGDPPAGHANQLVGIEKNLEKTSKKKI